MNESNEKSPVEEAAAVETMEAMEEVPLEEVVPASSPSPSSSSSEGNINNAERTAAEKLRVKASLSVSVMPRDPATYGFFQRRAAHMAAGRNPCYCFWVALILSLALSFIGLIVGDFAVAVDNAGWQSRGTLIADRHTQFLLVNENRQRLFNDQTGDVWRDLIDNVQPGWETGNGDRDFVNEALEQPQSRALKLQQALNQPWLERKQQKKQQELAKPQGESQPRQLPFNWTPVLQRKLQTSSTANDGGILDGCDVDWYTSGFLTTEARLWPIWRTRKDKSTASLFDADRITDICLSEEITQQTLIEEGLCFGCPNNTCLPPYSLVLFARLSVADGLTLDCEQLGQAWGSYFTDQVEQKLLQCVADIRTLYQPDRDGADFPDSCPTGFSPILIDELYDVTERVEFSSSIFATVADIDGLFDNLGGYSRGVSNLVEGVYDTQYEDFVDLQIDDSLLNDMLLALGSAVITAVAIVVHTRSPFLTIVGLLQIILSFPLAFFVYTFIGGLDFFPFLNFIGIFVVFALGADDIFVVVDKWKNARLKLGMLADTTSVAAEALPDAAGAMFLTTLTTAVAFFGTAICPVVRASLKVFVSRMLSRTHLLTLDPL
jgi:hypothetical protein